MDVGVAIAVAKLAVERGRNEEVVGSALIVSKFFCSIFQ